jgi:hypothetical protein
MALIPSSARSTKYRYSSIAVALALIAGVLRRHHLNR